MVWKNLWCSLHSWTGIRRYSGSAICHSTNLLPPDTEFVVHGFRSAFLDVQLETLPIVRYSRSNQIKSNLLKVLEIILILDCKMSPRPSNKSKQIIEGKCSHSPLASINSWGGGFPFQSLRTLDISARTAYSSQECKWFHPGFGWFWWSKLAAAHLGLRKYWTGARMR